MAGRKKSTREQSMDSIAKKHEGIFDDIKAIKSDPGLTLLSIANKHGLSKERIRQIFLIYWGCEYGEALAEKSNKRAEIRFVKDHDPNEKVRRYPPGSTMHKGAVIEALAMGICKDNGFTIVFARGVTTRVIDLNINGYKCEVKSIRNVVTYAGGYHGYHFLISERQANLADFIICCIVPTSDFYVIPMSDFPKGRSITIFQRQRSKYDKYKNAWNLLKREDAA